MMDQPQHDAPENACRAMAADLYTDATHFCTEVVEHPEEDHRCQCGWAWPREWWETATLDPEEGTENGEL